MAITVLPKAVGRITSAFLFFTDSDMLFWYDREFNAIFFYQRMVEVSLRSVMFVAKFTTFYSIKIRLQNG